MHLAPPQAVVVQVIETGVRETAVERPQLGQVEGILGTLVYAGQKPDQPA